MARQVVEYPENVGIIGDTGSGKTIVAILVAIALGEKTLVTAPTRFLAQDHLERYRRITGSSDHAVCITGETSADKRNWNNPDHIIVFCTAETFWADSRNGKISDIRNFGLFVLDECHTVTGKKESVKIAAAAHQFGKRIIALSASPGDNQEQIETIRRNCHLEKFFRLQVPMPTKFESLVSVALDKSLMEIDHLFGMLTLKIVERLTSLGVTLDLDALTIKKLKEVIATELEHRIRDSRYYEVVGAIAQAFYVRHAHFSALTESYATFIDHHRKLSSRKSRNVKSLLMLPEWRQAVKIALEESDRHPKVSQLVDRACEWARSNQRALVFVNNKDTGRHLERRLTESGLRVALIFGGKERKILMQQKTLGDLSAGKLDLAITTSTLEMGISVPAVDIVSHYSLPNTEKSRIQRSGRTGRFRPGEVLFFVLDHQFDKAIYWSVRKKEKEMKRIISGRQQTRPKPKTELPLFDGI